MMKESKLTSESPSDDDIDALLDRIERSHSFLKRSVPEKLLSRTGTGPNQRNASHISSASVSLSPNNTPRSLPPATQTESGIPLTSRSAAVTNAIIPKLDSLKGDFESTMAENLTATLTNIKHLQTSLISQLSSSEQIFQKELGDLRGCVESLPTELQHISSSIRRIDAAMQPIPKCLSPQRAIKHPSPTVRHHPVDCNLTKSEFPDEEEISKSVPQTIRTFPDLATYHDSLGEKLDAIFTSQKTINASIEAFPLLINAKNTGLPSQEEFHLTIDNLKVSTRELRTIEKRLLEFGLRDIQQDCDDICPNPQEMESELNNMEEFIRRQKAKPK